ncbi:hypothetical protein CBU02nite_37970 [Clostridium butyricum]|uniref:Restriction system protein Mrr-like N-terminal domain-containing protein n=1 Tax=Clostridium butyricum TaxID=1492 RepID=A0A512TT96_CLOBU|nr:winged helix-turn-helix domain-containing protein [Clostridium butyricum]NOW25509.1 hypothetical protein [Clostridium butyricum]GEQ23291.1 hypothetical protein CBU02nite_37970 [Clostridium butyricum]
MNGYDIGSRLSVQMTKEDEANKIIEFLNNQGNVSDGVKKAIIDYISRKGTGNISSISNTLPSQKEIEDILIEVLMDNPAGMELSKLYDQVAEKLNLTPSQLALKSPKTSDNVFKKKVRFAILNLKHRKIIENVSRGFVRLIPFLLENFTLSQIQNFENILAALNAYKEK